MDSQPNKNLKIDLNSSASLKFLSSPTASATSATSLDGPFNEKTLSSPASSSSSNGNGNSNGEYSQMPILEIQPQNKMDQHSPQEILVNVEIEGNEILNISKVQPTKPEGLKSTTCTSNKVSSLPFTSSEVMNKSAEGSGPPVNVNIKQEKDGSSYKTKINAVADSFTNSRKEKLTTKVSVGMTEQDIIRKELDKNNAFQEIVETEAVVQSVQSDDNDIVMVPEKKVKKEKVDNSEQSIADTETVAVVPNSRPERPKRAASARKHIGIEFPAEEQPYRRKKKGMIRTEVKSSTSSASGTNTNSVYQAFTAALNEPIAGPSSSSNGPTAAAVPRRISNRTSSKVSEQENLSNGNANDVHAMEIDADGAELKAQKSSCEEISFAISYSDEDKKSLYKVGKFVINKKDAIYNPYERDQEASTEDLDIYQIEERQLRLFEGLKAKARDQDQDDTIFHVSTEECILITSKDDLYRDYQPIYVRVIHIVKPDDPTKPDHTFAKYFQIDRIGPVLNLIPKTDTHLGMYATCLQTITTEAVCTGFMAKKIVQRLAPEEVFKAWAYIIEIIKVFYDDLLEIIPWDKEKLKLLEKYHNTRISTSAEDLSRFSGKLCQFCLSNKAGKKLLVLYGRKYNKMDFSDISDLKDSEPIPTCNDCLASVKIHSRIYHHLYHVYVTITLNIAAVIEQLKFPEVYNPLDLINYFIHDVYFVQKMFLDFQVILAECEKLTHDFYLLKEKRIKQENEANYTKLDELMKKGESLQSNANGVRPGPLKMKIKEAEKSIIAQMQEIKIEKPDVIPDTTTPESESELAPIDLQSQIDTTTMMEIPQN